ncbi:Heat shock protein 70 family [Penicillium angulare]|uniref:Heat shock protein 70 family n=1 Tax=Penicillium angulare TaxID=116970 RepID=A0A9W9KRN7_9EURO|nr:Heat shock protein 70 family [Penicillium angulare]
MGFLDEEKVPLSGPGERTKFKIAIDFGTTYSGIAFALEGCPESLEVIQEWPGGGNSKYPDVLPESKILSPYSYLTHISYRLNPESTITYFLSWWHSLMGLPGR